MKYYCLGIKGAGMSTLACILHDLGNEVSGYDDVKEKKFTEEGLNERNVKIHYEASTLDKDTIVTYSKALPSDHKELVRVKQLGLKIVEYNQIIGNLTSMFNTIGISGTHGKTTVSLMMSEVFSPTIGCNYFIGDGSGYAEKDNNIFILEADEYNKHFLAYHPTTAVITNIELDHTECYDGLNDIIKSFKKYASSAKLVVACGDDKNIRKINFTNKVIYYGFNENNDFVAKNLVLSEGGCSLDVYYNGEYFDHYSLPFFGKHMILNALATIITSYTYNIDKSEIKKRLSKFRGAKRRFKIENIGDSVIIDDYAHHPTEIIATINATKQKYPNKEIIAIFLPNTYSRTEALFDDFVNSFNGADKTYIMDIHSDREKQESYPNVNSDKLIKKIRNASKISLDNVEELLKHKGSVYCFMSCTNIYVLEDKFKEILKNH